MRRARVALLTALLLATGCPRAGSNATTASPTGLRVESAKISETAVQSSAYSTEAQGEVLTGNAATAEARAALERACGKAGMIADGRLATLAQMVAEASQQGRRAPQGGFVSFQAQRLGLIEPSPQLWLASASRADMLLSAMKPAVSEAARMGRLTHCGGALIQAGDMAVMAVAFSGRFVSLEHAIPQRVELGSVLSLDATLARGYARPSLAVTGPSGQVTRTPLPATRKFQHALRLDTAGEHTLEILAEGPEGLSVLAVFPVVAGSALDRDAPSYAEGPAEQDAAAVVDKLIQLIAAERAQRKLPPLHVDARITAIALAHTEDMAKHHFVAHTSKRTGEPSDRVQAAGLRANVVLENIARGYSAAEIHQGLMQSPGHRGNILHPDARDLGLGVVSEPEGERLAFLVTELFTQLDATRAKAGR